MNVWSERALPRLAVAVAAAAGALLFFAVAGATTPPPTTPPASITPVPVGTPWPPPTGLQLTGHVILLDEDNFPLPPDRQEHYRGISWAVLPGFTGVYEVQRAVRPYRAPATYPLDWLTITALPASDAVDGRIAFVGLVPASENLMSHCFRVRTVVGSVSGQETGPYSEPLCTPEPPSSGPGGPATASVVPLPPAVGNTPLTKEERGWLGSAAVIALALTGAAAVFGRRNSFGR